MKAKIPYLLAIILVAHGVQAQSLTKIKTINLQSPVENVSIDRQGNFYCSTANGNINKYDLEGQLLYQFSPSKNGAPTLIEAWQGLKVFGYYQNFQEYLFLDRFMNSSERFKLPSTQSSFLSLATMASDDNLWLIDEQSLRLKKIDLTTQQVIIDTPLNLNLPSAQYRFSHLRDYQNQLFISDPNQGLLIFDRFGNFSEQWGIKSMRYFNFVKNELYYLDSSTLQLVDLYTKKEREIELADPSYRFVLMENSILICFAANRIDLFQIN